MKETLTLTLYQSKLLSIIVKKFHPLLVVLYQRDVGLLLRCVKDTILL